MNTIYGKTAVSAAKELQKNKNANPVDVWNKNLANNTSSLSAQTKGCPKTTFLALCKEGFVKNVSTNFNFNNTSKNCDYARQMMQEIKNGNINSKRDLWDTLQHPNKPKNENGQSSVVFALFKNDLLNY